MEVKQIYEITNEITKEVLGEQALTVAEDLSNIVQVGEAVANANAYDNYVNALVNRIGKTVFVNRLYEGGSPKILMDNWEFGSVLQKIRVDLPEAQENETWELEDGVSYDCNIFTKPKVSAKFFNNLTTFEVPLSIARRQVEESFTSLEMLNSFYSMIFTSVENSLTVKFDELIQRTINNFIAVTVHKEYGSANINSKSTVKAINLLYEYNNTVNYGGTPLTVAKAWSDLNFIKYACMRMKVIAKRMTKMSKLFNIGEKANFTPKDRLHFVMLEDFKSCADVYLQSDAFHNEFTALPQAETVAYWQGTGTDYSLTDISKIDVTTTDNDHVVVTGVIGVMFDKYAIGVNNYKRYVETNYVGKASFRNYWYKNDARYFNDFDENGVVFFMA